MSYNDKSINVEKFSPEGVWKKEKCWFTNKPMIVWFVIFNLSAAVAVYATIVFLIFLNFSHGRRISTLTHVINRNRNALLLFVANMTNSDLYFPHNTSTNGYRAELLKVHLKWKKNVILISLDLIIDHTHCSIVTYRTIFSHSKYFNTSSFNTFSQEFVDCDPEINIT